MQPQINDIHQWRHKKKLFLVLLLTFLLNYSLRWLDSNPAAHSHAFDKLTNGTEITIDDLLKLL
jgi:hypothetical protein